MNLAFALASTVALLAGNAKPGARSAKTLTTPDYQLATGSSGLAGSIQFTRTQLLQQGGITTSHNTGHVTIQNTFGGSEPIEVVANYDVNTLATGSATLQRTRQGQIVTANLGTDGSYHADLANIPLKQPVSTVAPGAMISAVKVSFKTDKGEWKSNWGTGTNQDGFPAAGGQAVIGL